MNTEEKKFESKYGYFTADGREYVITRHDTPRPWVNVMSNGDYGTIFSQVGSGFSWRNNSNLSRLTRWDQDLIRDNWGKYVYVRDQKSGEFWSDTYKPCNTEYDFYQVRYGQGYSVFKSLYKGIAINKTVFVDKKDPVEVWNLEITNESDEERSLSFFTYFDWCLGNAADTHREFQKTFIETEIVRESNMVYGLKRPALVPGFISTGLSESPLTGFHACANIAPTAYDGDKESFVGRYGEITAPNRVKEGRCGDSEGKWGDPAASLQVDVTLAPGETKTVTFLTGSGDDKPHSQEIIKKYQAEGAAATELQNAKDMWNEIIGATQVETPDDAMNIMTNTWLKYQAISARIWAKCAYYQSSGGYGFRDQLQDSQIFYSTKPELARKQIVLHAEQQFPDGTVHHWWHHGTGMGAVTEMTDDLLWLAFLTLNYLDETDDLAFLDEKIPFLPDPETKEVTEGTLYDHCLRAIDKVLSRWSPRGLPLIGEGDWNDGMSHVGTKWKGESVWLGHFLYGVLTRIPAIMNDRGDSDKAAEYEKRAADLKEAINKEAWDGEWYIRATRDDGRPLGSKTQDRGKIFLNAQTWAVINGSVTDERRETIMNSIRTHLYKDYGPLLFTPGYDKTDPTIGYLSRYAASVRENGGLYTHAGTWAIQAESKMKEGEKALNLYRSFNPILRVQNDADNYYGEPYALPGNVDGPDSPNFGRGGWTWYTGAAAWYCVIAMNWFLGIRPTKEGLIVDPSIPADWEGYKMKRLFRGTTYEIEVSNPNKTGNKGVSKLVVDGKEVDGNIIPDLRDGGTHKVEVTLA